MELVGWSSSLILAVTIVHQVYKQWKQGSSEGVSIWLFLGQSLANTGFIVYSFHQRGLHQGVWVFTLTNSLLLVTHPTGHLLTLRQHHQEEHAAV
ncbi:MAG TPA: PQ-loop repeat-containing protein [Candidatus Obscuribacterales bacterium]